MTLTLNDEKSFNFTCPCCGHNEPKYDPEENDGCLNCKLYPYELNNNSKAFRGLIYDFQCWECSESSTYQVIDDKATLSKITLTLKEYQTQSKETAIYPKGFIYPALGLSGEAGEVAEHIKKALRDDDGKMTDERKEKLKKELGDVLWYLSQLSTELGLDLGDVAQCNLDKLAKRKESGKLKGSGSDR